jgi:fructooligosaccharide transport system substrate-binding protein
MKKTLKLLTLLVAISSLVGCGSTGGGGGGTGSSGATTIKVRFHVDKKSVEGQAYQKVIDAFNRDHLEQGLKAQASFVARTPGDSNYEKELSANLIAGTLPDIITFDAPNCAAYAKSGFLYDLTDYLKNIEADYLTLNKYLGRTYGVPIQESSAGFFYNKNLFRQAGVDVSGYTVDNPWNFDQFKAVCNQLKSHSITPVDMRLTATTDETATYLLYPLINAAGGTFIDETGYIAQGYFNSDASKRGFQFIKDCINAKYTGYDIGATDFHTGKVGMYLSSGWTIDELDHKFTTTFPNRDSWGLLPYPQDAKKASANGSWSFAVGNNSRKDKTPVVELLKYLTNAQSSKTITDATGMIPANKGVETNFAPNSPEGILMQQLEKTSVSRPVTPGYPQFSAAFASVISSLREKDVNELVDAKAAVLQRDLDVIK